MLPNTYSAGLMSQSFWFTEFKKVLRLRADGKTVKEIRTACVQDNLFGAGSEYRSKRMAGYLSNRAAALDGMEVRLFMESDLAVQKLLNLIAILRGDRLFFAFLFEVYREKRIFGVPELTKNDANIFFTQKEAQSPLVDSWKDTTKAKLRQCYFSFMTDANLLYPEGKAYKIVPPVFDPALERHLKAKGEDVMLQAVMGVRE